MNIEHSESSRRFVTVEDRIDELDKKMVLLAEAVSRIEDRICAAESADPLSVEPCSAIKRERRVSMNSLAYKQLLDRNEIMLCYCKVCGKYHARYVGGWVFIDDTIPEHVPPLETPS